MKKFMLLLCLSLCCCMLIAGCGGQPVSSSDGDSTGATGTSVTAKKTKATQTTKADGTTKVDGTTEADGTTTVVNGTTTKADGTTIKANTTTTVAATTKDLSKADSLLTATIDESISPGRCGSNHATLYDPAKDMESFLFYTDAHHAMHSYWKSTVESTFTYVKQKFDTVKSSFIVDGGDWLGADDTPAQALEKLAYIAQHRKANGLEKVLYFTVGNHDTNYQGVEHENAPPYSGQLDNKEIAKIWFPEYGRNYYRFESDKSSNYVLDSQRDDSTDEMKAYIHQELRWLCNDLKSNNAAHINIFSHIIYHNGSLTEMSSDLGRIMKAYNERLIFDFYGTVYDFSKNTGHIELVLSGHTHSEKATKLGGVPSINCTSYSQNQDGGVGYAMYHVIKDYKSKRIHVYRLDTGECRCYKLL